VKQKNDFSFMTGIIQLPLLVRERTDISIRSPQDICDTMNEIRELAQETFFVLTVSTKNKLIDKHMITLGIIDGSLIHAREAFRVAILDNSHNIVLVHNHPGGDPNPSAEDIQITKRFIEAGHILDIQVMDHVILGQNDSHFSMRESGIISFNKGGT